MRTASISITFNWPNWANKWRTFKGKMDSFATKIEADGCLINLAHCRHCGHQKNTVGFKVATKQQEHHYVVSIWRLAGAHPEWSRVLANKERPVFQKAAKPLLDQTLIGHHQSKWSWSLTKNNRQMNMANGFSMLLHFTEAIFPCSRTSLTWLLIFFQWPRSLGSSTSGTLICHREL